MAPLVLQAVLGATAKAPAEVTGKVEWEAKGWNVGEGERDANKTLIKI